MSVLSVSPTIQFLKDVCIWVLAQSTKGINVLHHQNLMSFLCHLKQVLDLKNTLNRLLDQVR